MTRTIFLLAMDYEIENIFDLNEWIIERELPFRVWRHSRIDQLRILRGGVGKANSAAATQYVLLQYAPKRVINIGVVGCLNREIAIGEVRQISECRFFDVDVTALDYQLGQIPFCDQVSYQLSPPTTETAKVISGDSFVTDQSKLQAINQLFAPDFIDMELAAIAHTLSLNQQLTILESYKAPSDYSDHSASQDFFQNQKKAFANLRRLAVKLCQP